MPLANAFLKQKSDKKTEKRFPLAITSCSRCGLVQTNYVVPAEQLYLNYLYVSSTSDAVGAHAITAGSGSLVFSAPDDADATADTGYVDIEILLEGAGSNDPWLQYDWDDLDGMADIFNSNFVNRNLTRIFTVLYVFHRCCFILTHYSQFPILFRYDNFETIKFEKLIFTISDTGSVSFP